MFVVGLAHAIGYSLPQGAVVLLAEAFCNAHLGRIVHLKLKWLCACEAHRAQAKLRSIGILSIVVSRRLQRASGGKEAVQLCWSSMASSS